MKTPLRRPPSCVACVLCLAVGSPAIAEPLDQVNLLWQAPAPCPDVSFVRAQLRRDLEGSQAPGEALDVRAVVEHEQRDAWRVSIHTQSAAGASDRSLVAVSCEALADATSLIIAMQIDPETAAIHARVIEGVTEPSTPVQPSPVPSTVTLGQRPFALGTPTRSTVPASETKIIRTDHEPSGRDGRSRLRGLIGVSVQRDWGTLPSASEVYATAIGVMYGSWRGEAGVGITPREEIARTSAPAIGSVRLLTATLRACHGGWVHADLGLSPCVAFEWAKWSSEGYSNLNTQRAESVVTAAVALRWVGTARISEDLRLTVPIDVLLPLSRPRFGVIQAAERQVVVFEPSWIALRAGVGVQLHFP